MKINSKSKVWTALAKSCDSPGDFIRCVMSLREETNTSLAEKLNTTPTYVIMVVGDKCSIGFKACVKIAIALDIDPYLLAHVWSDYSIRKLMNKEQK